MIAQAHGRVSRVRKNDDLRPLIQRFAHQNRFVVYAILKSMEVGPSFRCAMPKFPLADANYRILGLRPEAES